MKFVDLLDRRLRSVFLALHTVDESESLIRNQTVIVAKCGGEMVGSARGILDGAVCTVGGVIFDPPRQGRGIGAHRRSGEGHAGARALRH